jgi:outer membrane lipoprotein carrier protein
MRNQNVTDVRPAGSPARCFPGAASTPASRLSAIPLLILLWLALSGYAIAEPLSPPALKDLLDRIRQKRTAAPHVQANFREEKVIRLMNKPITSSGKVWFQPPNKFRREVTGNSPSIMVSDGQQLWIYYPNFKSVERYTLGKRSPLDTAMATLNTALNLENVENTFHITGRKIESGYELELTPRTPSMKRLFQKFNLRLNNDLLAERTEMLQPNGDRIVTIYSNQSRAPIPESIFRFTPQPGTDVTTPLGK